MSLLRWVPHRGHLPELPALPGTPVVLLHGLLGSPGNFELTARALIAAGAPVIAPEYGLRGTVPVERSLTELVDVLSPHLGSSRTVDIVGHSLGGLLGLRLAHEFPGSVRTLVGVGAAFRGLPAPRNPVVRRGIGTVMGRGALDLLTREPWAAEVPAGTRVVSIISDADRIVPRESSDLGEVVEVHGVRHEYLPSLAREISAALAWTP